MKTDADATSKLLEHQEQLRAAMSALRAIERIAGDEFCVDLNFRTLRGIRNQDLAKCERKLAQIYRISHAEDDQRSCHHVHTEWRKEKDQVLAEQEQ